MLVYSTLARRWNTHAPAPVRLPDDQVKALLGAVVLSAHDIGSQPVDLGPAERIGFVGTCVFGLAGPHDPALATLLGVLTRFAAYAGVGAQTTHGLGHVEPG